MNSDKKKSTQTESRHTASIHRLDFRLNQSGNAEAIARAMSFIDVGPKLTSRAVKCVTSECDTTIEVEKTVSELAHELIELIEEHADDVADLLFDQSLKAVKRHKKIIKGFERRLKITWGKGFELQEVHLDLSLGFGAEVNSQYRQAAFDTEDILFDVLMQQHAKACRIYGEINCLLRSGYADGAHARWRSLHETAVVSSFLSKQGEAAARLFRAHEGVHMYRGQRDYQESCEALGYEKLPDEQLQITQKMFESLIQRYGKLFTLPYGWAAKAMDIDRCGLERIEREAGLSHMRPFYRMASENVHPYSRSSGHELGLSELARPVLLSGPSNAGLADPGHQAALSMNVINASVYSLFPSMEGGLIVKGLVKIGDRIGEEFIQSHHAVEKEIEKRNAGDIDGFQTKSVDISNDT